MAHHDLEELPHGPLFGVTERSVYEPLLTQAALEDCQLSIHEVTWKADSLDPILKGFWDWGNIAALPAETQTKIEETTRENAQPYAQDGRIHFLTRFCMVARRRCSGHQRLTVYGLLLIASNLLMTDMARLRTYIRPLKLAYIDAGP